MKKNVFLWGLYDFGNSFITIAITGLYLSQWIIIDNKFDDIWYGMTFSLATILLLITSPFLGSWSDKIGKRLPFLKLATIVLIIFGFLLGVITNLPIPVFPKVISVLAIFLVIQYAYQISLIFFDTLLDQISTPKTRGKISGIGEAFAEFGWIIGPAVLLLFANGTITLFGTPGRSQVFLPAAILTALFTLPMLLWFKESRLKERKIKDTSSVYKETIVGIKNLIRKDKNVFLYLVSFMFVSDALLTLLLYFGVFLDKVYKITDNEKVIALVTMQIVATIAALIIGGVTDKLGSKRVMLISCLILVTGFTIACLLSNVSHLYFIAAFLGIGTSGFYVTGRALLINISPKERLGEYFGFYGTFQRFASILGPLLWGLIVLSLKNYEDLSYRIAGISMVLLMMIGIILLIKVKEVQNT
jgi:MFS transporter, UMF1 family